MTVFEADGKVPLPAGWEMCRIAQRTVSCIVTLANGERETPFSIESYADINEARESIRAHWRVRQDLVVRLIVLDPTSRQYCRPQFVDPLGLDDCAITSEAAALLPPIERQPDHSMDCAGDDNA